MTINISKLMASSGVQFGTSGVRGLVKDMTDKVCFAYVTAFLHYLNDKQLVSSGSKIGIAGDLRSSTLQIMNAVSAACEEMGFDVVNCGHIPSPAVALFGLKLKIPTIMVTGSHIPDDRNGIKFNTPLGEILKVDEAGIRKQQISIPNQLFSQTDHLIRTNYLPEVNEQAKENYIQRFIDFLPVNCLQGKQIGLYEHSSVSRDCLKIILQQLGATVTSLGRSEQFIAVDTEAIRPEDSVLAKTWSDQYHFDCILSTDGDGDRPLISDENGNWLRGDVAGILTAQYLDADTVITPVSSNSSVEKSGYFKEVIRTKIGSPYVIEAMQQAAIDKTKNVVAYEANGGFLQQTDIIKNNKTLFSLPTRDAVIVPLAILLLAQKKQKTISQLLMALPQRYTYSDRIKAFATERSQLIITTLSQGDLPSQLKTIEKVFGKIGKPVAINSTDGLRITFDNDDVIHLRPSGNAPELRCYTESESQQRAEQLNLQSLDIVRDFRINDD